MARSPEHPPYPAEGPVRSPCWLRSHDRRQAYRSYRKAWTSPLPAAELKQLDVPAGVDVLETTPVQGNA